MSQQIPSFPESRRNHHHRHYHDFVRCKSISDIFKVTIVLQILMLLVWKLSNNNLDCNTNNDNMVFFPQQQQSQQEQQEQQEEEGEQSMITRGTITPRIGAYYYTWYTPAQWQRWKTLYSPSLGLYNSTNRNVLEQHFQWARRAGIEFFVVSWEQGQHETVLDYLQQESALPITLHFEMQAFWYHNMDEFDFLQRKAHMFKEGKEGAFGDLLIDYFCIAMDEIILPHRDKYVFVHNRPVFVLYLAREFKHHNETFHKLRSVFDTRYGIQPYLIADAIGLSYSRRAREFTKMKHVGFHQWDAITAYNLYEGRSTDLLEDYLLRVQYLYNSYSTPTLFRGHQQYQKHERTLVIPYVQPGYDDTLIRANETLNDETPRPVYHRNYGQTYHVFWDVAEKIISQNPCEGVDPSQEVFIFVTTFNEWHESTSIEPTKEWGEQYLRITKNRSKRFQYTCDDDVTRSQIHYD